MPPEQAAAVRAWLEKGAHDLTAARLLLEAAAPPLDVVVYHCQQTAEKALKAFLTSRDCPFGRTHALGALVSAAAQVDSGFESLQSAAEVLAPYASRFRYPGEPVEPTMDEAQEALELAERVLAFVRSRTAA